MNTNPSGRKAGRPPLAVKSNRIKLTIDVTPETHAELTQLRADSGLSFGRIIDGAVSRGKRKVK